jgi:hypothetical protein
VSYHMQIYDYPGCVHAQKQSVTAFMNAKLRRRQQFARHWFVRVAYTMGGSDRQICEEASARWGQTGDMRRKRERERERESACLRLCVERERDRVSHSF